MAPGIPAPTSAASFAPEGLFRDLLEVSLTAVNLLRPVYGPGGTAIVDFTLDYLNPAAQRMSQLPERPGGTLLSLRPGTTTAGILDYYRRTFETGAAEVFEVNYQAEGLDNFFRLAARRSGDWLVVSFTDTGDQPRTPVERALREAQAAEQAARAEAEAQRQRQRFYEVLMRLPAYVAVYQGPDHTNQFVNPPYQRMFPHRAFPGRPFREVMPEAIGLGVVALFDQVYQSGEPYYGYEMEGWFDFEDTGELQQLFFNLCLHPLRDAQGRVDGMLNFSYDVTEQVRARRQVEQFNQELETRVAARTQEALALQADLLAAAQRQAQEREAQRSELQRLFEQAPAAVFVLHGPEHTLTVVNPLMQELLGPPLAELLGRPYFEALPELAAQGYADLLDRVWRTGQPFTAQEQPARLRRHRPGETGYFTFVYQPLHDAQGRISDIMCVATDVTGHVHARQASEASARQLRLITDALPVLIGYLDREEKYRFANRAYEPWFQRPAAELLGRSIREVAGEQAYPNIQPYIQRALAGEEVVFEAEMPFRPGFTRHIRTSYIPDVQHGVVQGFYTLVNDVTDQVEARRQVDHLNQELAAINEALISTNDELNASNTQLTRTNVDLDNFIYTASHDLKAPITNIEGLLDTLRHELPELAATGEVAFILNLMQDSVERFKRTIDHLTEVSKLQKEHDLPTAQVVLPPVLEDVRQDLAPLLQQTGGRLHVRVQGCPPLRFSEKNLRSVLYNLLSNALKYRHPDRVPEVHVRYRPEADCTVLEVQDNGLGFDLAREKQLFAMFQRLHTHVEGSGLGLFMVKRIMENAGGKITVRSQVGEGTTFAVHFPH